MGLPRLVLLAASLALAACASVRTQIVPLGTPQAYPPTLTVEVLLQKPDRPYTEIALIESKGEVGASEADLLNDAREKAKALGADAIVRTEVDRIYHEPVPVYDPWYDPLFFGYYRYRPFAPFPHPWMSPYRFVGGGVSYTLKALAIRYQPIAGQSGDPKGT
jgi:hypothetical protein